MSCAGLSVRDAWGVHQSDTPEVFVTAALITGSAAMVAAPRLSSFPQRQRGDDEARCGVGPPPVDGGVEEESGEEHRGQVGAEHGLCGVGEDRCAVHCFACSVLGDREERHDDE